MPVLTYEDVFDRVASLSELGTLANSLGAILKITRGHTGDARQLANVISNDPALSLKILQTVNSAFYAFDRTIDTVMDAVALLGFAEIERLGMAVSIINHFGTRSRHAKALNQLWKHSLVCGVATEALVDFYKVPKSEDADVYVAALMHDIGKAVIWQVFPDVTPQIAQLMEYNGIIASQAEQRVLGGATHAEIGAWAAQHCSLPLSIVESVQWHHRPDEAKTDRAIIRVIHAANGLCYQVRVPAAALRTDQAPPPIAATLAKEEALMARFRNGYEAKRAQIEAILRPASQVPQRNTRQR
ncbi:MAG TPA: HDOD domain-containing protein [Candidatus Hydrogenedentes bacterium]|nr:HDOD domain-containing protein [Candidatus Hydrogenedentota bacterium]